MMVFKQGDRVLTVFHPARAGTVIGDPGGGRLVVRFDGASRLSLVYSGDLAPEKAKGTVVGTVTEVESHR